MASPTSQLECATDDDKKLYAQSLESTENSVSNVQVEGLHSSRDLLLYPVCLEEYDTSTDGMFLQCLNLLLFYGSDSETQFYAKHRF